MSSLGLSSKSMILGTTYPDFLCSVYFRLHGSDGEKLFVSAMCLDSEGPCCLLSMTSCVVYSDLDVFDFSGEVVLTPVAVLVLSFAHENTFHYLADLLEASDFR